jgi:hypothetical protein
LGSALQVADALLSTTPLQSSSTLLHSSELGNRVCAQPIEPFAHWVVPFPQTPARPVLHA